MNATTKTPQIHVSRPSSAYWRITFHNPPLNVLGPEFVLELLQLRGAWAQLFPRLIDQRCRRRLVHFMKVGHGFVSKQNACDYFVRMPLQISERFFPVRDIVILGQAGEAQHAAIVHSDVGGAGRRDLRDDLAGMRDEIGFGRVHEMLPGVKVTLGGTFVIVERDAG